MGNDEEHKMPAPAPLRTVLRASVDSALAKTTEALKSEGFGVLTEIDVQGTLKQKLGVEMGRYRILGACNPPFAHQAIQLNPEAGMMMPCNVVVYETAAGEVVVSAVDPTATSQALEDTRLAPLAATIRERLARVIAKL
jgi:uncharacterized protein (DUF302 family)